MLSGPGRAAAHAGTLGTMLEGSAGPDLGDLVTYIKNLAAGTTARSRVVTLKDPPATLLVDRMSTAATLEVLAYTGAVYSPYQNRIYFVPYNQATNSIWHYVDCTSGKVVPYAHEASGLVSQAYWGGVYDPVHNRIYFVPHKQAVEPYWHYLNCDDGSIRTFNRPDTIHSSTVYMGGAYCHAQKRIYLAPYGYDKMYYQWHYIDTETCTAVSYDSGATSDTIETEAYSDAVYSPSQQRTYFIPNGAHAERAVVWHYIDNTINDASSAVVAYARTVVDVDVEDSDSDSEDSSSDTDTIYPSLGGAFSATQNRIYFPPYSIDCSIAAKSGSTQLAPLINRRTRSDTYHAGLVPDLVTDRIYLLPKRADGIYRYIDCREGGGGGYVVKKYGGWAPDEWDLWRGGAFSPGDNRIYMAPNIAPRWAAIATPSETVADHRIAANPLFNGSI